MFDLRSLVRSLPRLVALSVGLSATAAGPLWAHPSEAPHIHGPWSSVLGALVVGALAFALLAVAWERLNRGPGRPSRPG